YGGSCFPKDTLALVRTAQQYGAPVRIVEAVEEINKNRKKSMVKRVEAAVGALSGKTIAVLGLTFKPNTDDMRDSPSLDLIPALEAAGATIRAHDPEGMEEAKPHFADILYCDGPYHAMEGADACVILTEWNAYRALDLPRVKSLLTTPIIVDLRNVYDPEVMAKEGFHYSSIGRP
ncbi:MAG: UDP binding domain-containing protein, partial [Pseudomonadota bacterium]